MRRVSGKSIQKIMWENKNGAFRLNLAYEGQENLHR